MHKWYSINRNLRYRSLAAGITESQAAGEVAAHRRPDGRAMSIDGNYVSKLERGVMTWPNRAYRAAFRRLFRSHYLRKSSRLISWQFPRTFLRLAEPVLPSLVLSVIQAGSALLSAVRCRARICLTACRYRDPS